MVNLRVEELLAFTRRALRLGYVLDGQARREWCERTSDLNAVLTSFEDVHVFPSTREGGYATHSVELASGRRMPVPTAL